MTLRLCLTALLFVPMARAQETSNEAFPTLRKMVDFWNLSDKAKSIPHPFDLAVTVAYYDPDWNLLWGEEGGIPFFQPTTPGSLPLKAGQHLRLQGSISQTGMKIDPSKIEVLASGKPIEYAPADSRVNALDQLSGRAISLELLVDEQTEIDERHFLLHGVVQGEKINIRILRETSALLPIYTGAFVRSKGVFVQSKDAAKGLTANELWVAGPEDIKHVSWLGSDPRFDTATFAIADLRQVAASGKLVKVMGHVQRQNPGRSLVLRDATGELTAETAQVSPLGAGDLIEIVGIPELEGVSSMLRKAIYRPAASKLDDQARNDSLGLPQLRLVDQVRKLDPNQAAKGYPVLLYGIVTWAHPDADFFFVQDASGGVRVRRGDQPSPYAQTFINLDGLTVSGLEGPEIKAKAISRHAHISPPPSDQLTLEQVRTGLKEAQLIEISGFVRQIRNAGRWSRMELTTPSGEFSVMVPATEPVDSLHNAVVRAKGVSTRLFDQNRRFAGIEIWVSGVADITIIGAKPAEPFSLPLTPIASLDSSRSFTSENPWVRIKGLVTYYRPGRYLIIQSNHDCIMVLSRSEVALRPEDNIEAVGIPGQEQGRTVIREAILRRQGSSQTLAPLDPDPTTPVDLDLDCHLVRIEGEILDSTPSANGQLIVVRRGRTVFEANLPRSEQDGSESPCKQGSKVRVTGIYMVERNEYHEAQGFHLDLRSQDDIQVLAQAPWWTPQRAISVVIIMGLLGFGASAWILMLRRQVQAQTRTIREQMERETRMAAEIERSMRLESLGNLAGGIAHDFNNILTIIIGNLSLAKLENDQLGSETVSRLDEAEKGAQRARVLTQQLLTFARGGNPVRKAHELAPLVREACEQYIEGTGVHHLYEEEPGLWPAHIDREQMHHVLRNILTNAVQAMPGGGHIVIIAQNLTVTEQHEHQLKEGRYLRVSISDSGPGIAPENIDKVFDPYFSTKGANRGLGLATVRSILRKHNGSIEVTSTAGEGCTFILFLPASAENPAAGKAAAAVRTRAASAGKRSRILFMDDEASIQTLAAGLFKKLGHEYSLASDGGEALSLFRTARAEGRPYDLVITDLTVPKGMGGKELMEELRSIDPKVRAIVSSGYSSDPIIARFREYGFIGCVPKPYEIADFEKCLNEALSGDT